MDTGLQVRRGRPCPGRRQRVRKQLILGSSSASGAMTSAWAPIFGARRQFDSAVVQLLSAPALARLLPMLGQTVVCQAVEPRPCKRASSKGWKGGGLRGWEEDKDSLGRRRKGRCHIPLAA